MGLEAVGLGAGVGPSRASSSKVHAWPAPSTSRPSAASKSGSRCRPAGRTQRPPPSMGRRRQHGHLATPQGVPRRGHRAGPPTVGTRRETGWCSWRPAPVPSAQPGGSGDAEPCRGSGHPGATGLRTCSWLPRRNRILDTGCGQPPPACHSAGTLGTGPVPSRRPGAGAVGSFRRRGVGGVSAMVGGLCACGRHNSTVGVARHKQ